MFNALMTQARQELRLPEPTPATPGEAAVATPMRGVMGGGPAVAAAPVDGALDFDARAIKPDAISRDIRTLGGKWRPGAQALNDVATGRGTMLSPDAVAAARPFQAQADAHVSAMFVDAAARGQDHMPRAPRTTGNSVKLLVRNEAYLPELYRDLPKAQRSITINQFNWEPDGSGRKVIDMLKERAQAGVDVRITVDGYGFREKGFKAARALQNELEAAGVKLERSWGFVPKQGWEHRKMIVIDDAISYSGGLGFGAKYDTWTDLMMRVEGPGGAVAGTNALATWRDLAGPLDANAAARLHGNLETLSRSAAERAAVGETGAAVTFLENRPKSDLAATESFLRDAKISKDRFWATSTNVTTPTAVDAMIEAANRGVDVKLVVSGPEVGNDVKTIMLGRSHYQRMLDAGVEIFERTEGIMHAKSWIADDVATVGSMNLSHSSMTRAREVMARVEDAGFADDYVKFHTMIRGEARQVTPALLQTTEMKALSFARKLVGLRF
ncbi:MAG: Cardiolipin synthetase [Thermoleophilia bacterium]|nr:Cardiolipin synthetase [Thermoleophilia bacterium]